MIDSEMDGENDLWLKWWRLGVNQVFFKIELGVDHIFYCFERLIFTFVYYLIRFINALSNAKKTQK